MPKLWNELTIAAFGGLLMVLTSQTAMAACPAVTIEHSTNENYSGAELCSNSQYPSSIRLIVWNPSTTLELTDLSIAETLPAGMTYVAGSASVASVRYGTAPTIRTQTVSGNTLTITLNGTLDPGQNSSRPNYLYIDFEVYRPDEGLVSSTANYTFSALLSFNARDEGTRVEECTGGRASSGNDVVPLLLPEPGVAKVGWNVDAGQTEGQAAATLFGHDNDDVIWRLEFTNGGRVPMQDLIFDDTMVPGNMLVNYVCTSAGAATGVANANGAGPGACFATYKDKNNVYRPVGNTIADFAVDDPFGNPSSGATATWDVDVPAGGAARIYLVGKLLDTAACSDRKTNTLSGIEYGCQVNPPDGGITRGVPGPASATLYTRYGDRDAALRVNRQLTGTNTAQPVGTKGTMTVTLTNTTGGSVTFTDTLAYHLKDTLPPEYVMDPTYLPTIAVTSLYGAYAGRVDRISWTNPVAINPSDPTSPLGNTAPEFKLSSSTVHPRYADQKNLMRHGDVLTITFRVVLIKSDFYDRAANLDVTPELYPDTDPTYQTPLVNTLVVRFDTFCPAQGTQTFTLTGNGTVNPTGTAIRAFPEELDIAIGGAVFILTGDPSQILTLPVRVTNNGGHDAADYHLFVSFGATMEVVNAPAGCRVVSLSGTPPQPDPWKVWVNPPTNPIPIPSTATVYECSSPATIAPGSEVTFNFGVIKTTDPVRIAIDDLSFRADVVGEIELSDGTPLWFPAPIVREDGELDRANNYSLDAVWARVIGFNLKKTKSGTCNENNPPIIDIVSGKPVERVEIGEECTFHIETGGWFGFETPGFAYIAVQNIDVTDESPEGQGYISNAEAGSTSRIKNVTLNPAGLAPVTEGWFDWRFNVADADRIEVADEWFRVNVTSRLLNDALNNRAAPNFHGANSHNILNSTFDATFSNLNTGATETFTLGPGTVGYPNEAIRRVDLTVTEPFLTVVKEVCNESLSTTGSGPACSPWTTLADRGDTYDSYIYRISVTNEAASGGLARSPAYDVVVTDTLDASDLIYVVPFAGDGIDNDADAIFDEAGTDEGAISDNLVLNSTPAVITFSHTQSAALQRINPGASVQLYYRVDPDQRIAPMQTLTNTASASYDTLAGSSNESGNQTVDLRPSGDLGGARVYTAAPASAQVRIIPLLTYPKEIVTLSHTPLSGAQPQEVMVGEEIAYRLAADIPVARLRDFVIQDLLPAGLSCSEAPVLDPSLPPYAAAGFTRPDGSPVPPITSTCASDRVIWDFGDVVLTRKPAGSSYFDFQVSFIARVENSASNNEGTVLKNGVPATRATLTYVDENNISKQLEFGQVDVVIREPRIELTKAFAVASADAGDELLVTVTATNYGTANAYNLQILDDLTNRNLTFIQGSVSGADPPDLVDTSTFGLNQPIFTWNPDNPLPPGALRAFTFKVRVDTAAQPLEVLDNILQAAWTSLPGQNTALNSTGSIGANGSTTGMRIGTLPNSNPADTLNDYEVTATASVQVLPLSMSKTEIAPSVLPEIGAHKNFRIEILLPEGTTKNLVVTDNLAAGTVSYLLANNADFAVTYEFTGLATLNGQVPSEAALLAFPADGTAGAALWNFGEVVTATENDPAERAVTPRIRITYQARVNNDLATNAGSTLQNGVALRYSNGETGATETLNAATARVTAIESSLAVTKSVTPITPLPLTGGSILEYAITVVNGGNATAYDVNLVDTLPAELWLQASFDPTATINGAAAAGFVATPTGAPAGPLVWGRDNGDGSLDLPAGATLVLTYRVQIQEATGSTFNNQVWVDWTSLQAASAYERTGAGCPSFVAPDDYCIGATSTPQNTTDTTRIAKSVLADSYATAPSTASDAIVRVGDTAIYRLLLNLQEGNTRSVRVEDQLPIGLSFAGVVSINGDTAAPYEGVAPFTHATIAAPALAGDATTGTKVTWNLGTIYNTPDGNAGNDTFVIEYRVAVAADTLAHQATMVLNNTATLSYTDASGSPVPFDATRMSSSAILTVRQPIMTMPTKTDRSGFITPANVNVAADTMQFRLESCNATGQAPAYSVKFTDLLASQLDEMSVTTPVVTVGGSVLSAGTDYLYTPPATRGSEMTLVLSAPVDPGECVTIDYTLGFHTDFGPNQTWENSVVLDEYWSLPPASGEMYGPLAPVSFIMTNNAIITPPAKTLLSPAGGKATIGEPVTYEIRIPGLPLNAALDDVVVTDNLDPSLVFVEAIAADANGAPVSLGTTRTGQTLTWSVGDIPAGQQVVITLTARVANSATSDAGDTFTNRGSYTYTGATESWESLPTAALTIVEPAVTVTKGVTPNVPPTAGDILHYAVDLTATSGINFSSPFDTALVDTLSLGLEYLPGTALVGGVAIEPTVTGDGGSTAQTLTWTGIDLPAGAMVAVAYEVRVLDSVTVGQILTNSVMARWTSLDGDDAYERTGSGEPAWNDYFAAAGTSLTIADTTTLAKIRLSDTWNAGDANLRVGDLIDYELRLGLQEGTHNGVVLTDTLPTGMVFEGVVSADFFGTPGTAAPAVSGQTLTWDLGTVTNVADNNAANDALVIVYRARVLNNDALAQQNSTPLTNLATLDYTIAGAPAPQLTASQSITVLQPALAVSKSAAPAGGDTIIEAGEFITYTLDITNNGAAPAYDTLLVDTLPVGLRKGGVTVLSITLGNAGTTLPLLPPAYDPVSGVATWNFDSGVADRYTIPAGEILRLVYAVQADADLGPGLTLTNAATATHYYSFDDEAVPANGEVSGRELYGPTNTAQTTLTTPMPGALLKENTQPTAAIGEQFRYRITVPAAPLATALHDVRILDDLDLSAAALRFVSVANVGAGSWTLVNSGTGSQLVIEDTINGIDIPAHGQAVIEITVELLNSADNNRGLVFNNSASYTYNQVNGDPTTQLAGGASATSDMTVVEPVLTATKTVRNVTPGKGAGDPAAGGDILEYLLTIANSGDSVARDVNVVDTLPPELALIAGSATAQIAGAAVSGFDVNPATLPGGALAWGRENSDGSLDIPAGESLLLTYRVNVIAASGADLTNSAWVDWTSLDGPGSAERTGAGCPAVSAPDDYCFGPATAATATIDTNRIAKSIVSDSWNTGLSTGTDAILRVGDTVTSRLGLTLREGLTGDVVVRDVLPSGLVFDGVVSVNGDATAPYSAGGPFSYTDVAPPAISGNTIAWTFGNIFNAVDNNTANDTLVIEYRARVVEDTLAHTASTLLANHAALSYAGGDPLADPARLTSSATVEVRQPVVVTVTKRDRLGRLGTAAAPLNVNVATDTMQFRLEACNESGSTAPAYRLLLNDQLAGELDETSINLLSVSVGGVPLAAGDYVYTPPAVRGGAMSFLLDTPVDPGRCATVDYDIGFHTDLSPNHVWNNSVTLSEYWSLPAAGQRYLPVGPSEFWMTNATTIEPPLKSLFSPVGGEATIGETVVYRITVPGSPVNAALNGVVITDALDPALVYESASVAGPFALTDNSVAPGQVNLTIAQIPAGEQAVITVTTRVANADTTDAGDAFSNEASYTYSDAGQSWSSLPTAELTIVEPAVSVTKSVTPNLPPTSGDILHYAVDLTAATGPDLSTAFDLALVDTLGMGLEYVAGTARVGGVSIEPAVGGDGVMTAQTLTWTGIDLPEGTTVAVAYDVRVLNSIGAGQTLTNSVTARWTGLDGDNPFERNGSGTPPYNDYFATAATTLTTPDATTLAKGRLTDTWNAADGNLRIGDLVEYELRLGLQEGTHTGLLLADTLPAGLVFEGVVSADFFGTPGPAAAVVSGRSVTWNLGTVVNAADNDPANDFLVIVYRARVLNGDLLAQLPTTQTLTNQATLDYTVNGLPATPKRASESVTVLQPVLAVSKGAAPAGGDSVIAAGELITCTVDLVNSGDAPAYDSVLVDALPAGLRQGGVTVISITLVNAGTTLPLLPPAYDPVSGVATWNFDSGVADRYTIPAGETLRVVYQVSADADLGASLTLVNAATATHYFSFDDEAVPVHGDVSEREVYGPTNTAQTTLTTPVPGALLKENTQPTAAIGEQFSYRITVPAMALNTALHDVRIVDDLGASAADLRLVSVARIGGSGSWTPVNTGSDTQLVIEDTTGGIDIPAGEQAVIELTVELLNTGTNVSGLTFTNTADYTYNRLADTLASQTAGLPGTTAEMTIAGPDSLTLEKSGPATMRVGVPGIFTLNVQNTGTARAWDLTIVDQLPNPTPGGMCGAAPSIVSAQVFAADGVTAISAPLVAGTDFIASFATGSPACTFTITGLSAAASIDPQQRLIVTYQAELDPDNGHGITLANIAAATRWFSQETGGAGATGEARTYTRTLTDGTVAVLDHEDAHTITTESPTLAVQKRVLNVTTGQNPGSNAQPGDRLRYSVQITNLSDVDLPNFSLFDDLGALNATALFVPGSLTLTALPAGADATATDANGGTGGAGLLDLRNLALGAQGTATATLLVEFEVTLAPVITSGTLVLNQAHLTVYGYTLAHSDDPAVNGADDPAVLGDEDSTRTLISAAPLFQVWKTSQVLTGDTTVLMAGDTLRYTLTIKNIGTEDAVDVRLRDYIPANTTYLANSTRLNGLAVADPGAGVSPLQSGLLVNAPEDTRAGYLRADAAPGAANVAMVTFDVVVDPGVMNGLIIENQGFVAGSGLGSGPQPEHSSDDPATPTLLDPTRDVVGNLPLLGAQKTVRIKEGFDFGSPGIVDPGDLLLYTIRISNYGAIPATGLVLTDLVPANTAYVADSLRLNGVPVGVDGGVSPLIGGLPVHSADAPDAGTVSAGGSAEVTFEVRVNDGVPTGTIISNQGSVTSSELPRELTDADGLPANGRQPTIIVVGDVQLLSVTKEVLVVGGGTAEAGGELEYVIRVTNTGTLPITHLVVTDDLGPLGAQVTYVAGSGSLNGVAAGVSYAGSILSADYAATYGDLPPGAGAVVRFRVGINPVLPIGTTIVNTGIARWNEPAQSASASVSLDLGGSPGSASLNGNLWHDANLDKLYDGTEQRLEGWSVELYRSNQLVATVRTDASGAYRLSGLVPNEGGPETWELRFRAPGAGLNTATLGYADSRFINGPQRISGVTVASGGNLQDLNLPISPNGAVYNSVLRVPVAGARLTLLNAATGAALPGDCFDDPAQQNQVTPLGGYYKFDLNFGDPACQAGAAYLIEVAPPATGYVAAPSQVIPPTSSEATSPFAVPACPGSADDAVPSSGEYCEVVASASVPPLSIAPRTAGTTYHLHLTLSNGRIPGDSQVFNNPIPIDPVLDGAVAITKTSSLINVTKGQLVPYTITVNNVFGVPLYDIGLVDRFPAGFKYVEGSARLDGTPREPRLNGRELVWDGLELQVNASRTLQLLLVVGAGVSEGEYVNRAQVLNTATGGYVSGEATATVRVIPDPIFDCTDVIGKVFDDRNLNGDQDAGEEGLAGVRVVTARGLIATADQHGRFHLTCAMVPDEDRGSNFILKLDDRSLPTGYRVTTENPRVQRATRGKMMRFNFGATIHRVVGIDTADGAFEPNSTELRLQWKPQLARLLEELAKGPAVLRLSYLAEVEHEGLVRNRLAALKKEIAREWSRSGGGYRLDIETEVFWRRGAPP